MKTYLKILTGLVTCKYMTHGSMPADILVTLSICINSVLKRITCTNTIGEFKGGAPGEKSCGFNGVI